MLGNFKRNKTKRIKCKTVVNFFYYRYTCRDCFKQKNLINYLLNSCGFNSR